MTNICFAGSVWSCAKRVTETLLTCMFYLSIVLMLEHLNFVHKSLPHIVCAVDRTFGLSHYQYAHGCRCHALHCTLHKFTKQMRPSDCNWQLVDLQRWLQLVQNSSEQNNLISMPMYWCWHSKFAVCGVRVSFNSGVQNDVIAAQSRKYVSVRYAIHRPSRTIAHKICCMQCYNV